jgi:putative phosphoribosyl transferase
MNEDVAKYVKASDEYLEEEKQRQIAEANRRLRAYRGDRPYPTLRDRSVIIVDDGVATGATMIAALDWAKSRGAGEVIAATPVAPRETVKKKLPEAADRVLCPETPEPFYSIGQFYQEFPQVEDEEVIELLQRRRKEVLRTD